MHPPNLRMQVAAAHILVLLTAADNGLHADHALALNLAVAAVAVENMPVAAVQLHREGIVIFDGNTVGEHELRLQRVRVILLIERLHADLNTLRNHTDHKIRFCVQL